MAQVRGSAGRVAVILAMVALLGMVDATTYTVGDDDGWTFYVDDWPQGKSFKANDVLVFNYNPKFHNVVAVPVDGYSDCTTPVGSKFFRSGKDHITLAKGDNYFICDFIDHCLSGMKIKVTAA